MQSKMLFLTYSREIREFLYNNYYYHNENQYENETLYLIDENLSMTACSNDSLLKILRKKMNVYKYINNYTYHADRLTKNQIFEEEEYSHIYSHTSYEQITCTTPEVKPSEKEPIKYYLLTDKHISTKKIKYKKIKISLSAEVFINDSLWQDEYMNLEFNCNGENMKYPIQYKDKIVKFIPEEVIRKNKWYHLKIHKEFLVKNAGDLSCSIYIVTPTYDNEWIPNTKLTIQNINIKIEGLPLIKD